jgi:hypothetical protein
MALWKLARQSEAAAGMDYFRFYRNLKINHGLIDCQLLSRSVFQYERDLGLPTANFNEMIKSRMPGRNDEVAAQRITGNQPKYSAN